MYTCTYMYIRSFKAEYNHPAVYDKTFLVCISSRFGNPKDQLSLMWLPCQTFCVTNVQEVVFYSLLYWGYLEAKFRFGTKALGRKSGPKALDSLDQWILWFASERTNSFIFGEVFGGIFVSVHLITPPKTNIDTRTDVWKWWLFQSWPF